MPLKASPRRASSALPLLLPAATLFLAISGVQAPLSAQTLPASAPTHPTATLQPLSPAAVPATPAPAAMPAYRAKIDLAKGMLSVIAENSSLNEILRDISKLTGMKITGGVTEERVFGLYGPASAQVVLSQLLEGTGANILLHENDRHDVTELVLTPRTGGPTPPNPNAVHDDRQEADLPPQLGGRHDPLDRGRPGAFRGQQSSPNGNPPAAPTDNGSATQQSPNGVRTPQQIYQDLSNRQQQQPTPPPQP